MEDPFIKAMRESMPGLWRVRYKKNGDLLNAFLVLWIEILSVYSIILIIYQPKNMNEFAVSIALTLFIILFFVSILWPKKKN